MKENLRSLWLALAVAVGAAPCAALAQSAPTTPSQSATPPAQEESCEPPAKPLPPSGTAGQGGCQSDGVIRPPITGDRGVLKPPDTGTSMPMPVIPPPGTPGSNQNVQPK